MEYREQVQHQNRKVFAQEEAERNTMRLQAENILRQLVTDIDRLRQEVPWMKDLSPSEIMDVAQRMKDLAKSPHPLDGFWDLHGRVANG